MASTMLTLTVQTTIEAETLQEYERKKNKIVEALEKKFDSVDITSEDGDEGELFDEEEGEEEEG